MHEEFSKHTMSKRKAGQLDGGGISKSVKQWAVLQTVEENNELITIAPTRWIEGDVLLWPKTTASLGMVRDNTTDPGSTWERIPIKDRFGIFETFDAACRVESALSESETSDAAPRDDRVMDSLPPPTIKTTKKVYAVPQSQAVIAKQSFQKSQQHQSSQQQHLSSKQPLERSKERQILSASASASSSTALPVLNDEVSMAAIIQNQKLLMAEITNIRQMLAKREEFEKKLVATTIAEIQTILASAPLALATNLTSARIQPIRKFECLKTYDELLEFEKKLNEADFFSKTVSQLKNEIGNQESCQHAAAELLNILMTADLQRMCSYTGISRTKGVPAKHPLNVLSNLESFFRTVCSTAKQTYPSTNYHKHLQKRLKGATKHTKKPTHTATQHQEGPLQTEPQPQEEPMHIQNRKNTHHIFTSYKTTDPKKAATAESQTNEPLTNASQPRNSSFSQIFRPFEQVLNTEFSPMEDGSLSEEGEPFVDYIEEDDGEDVDQQRTVAIEYVVADMLDDPSDGLY